MTTKVKTYALQDSLYGRIRLDDAIIALVEKPLVQRLRHIRLSNIDSIDMPGIANLSRFEHVLGVAYLASEVAFRSRLSHFEDLVLKASAVLHDWAITSFGHLVEEALQYVDTGFTHEKHLRDIVTGNAPEEILGVQRQILVGRETGLQQWLRTVTRSDTEGNELLAAITEHIVGKGRFGRVICGDIDLDNIDNVYRMAYHMGLPIDREVPRRLAKAIIDCDAQTSSPIFQSGAERDIQNWLSLRSIVYEHLMLAERDFAGKSMMLYATIRAFEGGEISGVDWSLTDFEFIQRLISSAIKETKDTAERWIAGDVWDQIPLHWMEGERPNYVNMRTFSSELSKLLDRVCFGYGIRDKRDRRLVIMFSGGRTQVLGENRQQWVLGIGSPERRPFAIAEVTKALQFAQSYFNTGVVAPASSAISRTLETQPLLL